MVGGIVTVRKPDRKKGIMTNYRVFYKSKSPIEVYADTPYEAQTQAAVLWNLKPSQRKTITVFWYEARSKMRGARGLKS